MNLLAFDTSTEAMAVAVCGAAVVRTTVEAGGKVASARLLPCIREQLAGAGLAFDKLDSIAFGHGPGAFTGLRTSCAVAQGLAFGLGLRLLPLDSLLIVAEDARQQAGAQTAFEIGVAMDARMGEVYAGRYRWDGTAWATLMPPALVTLAALVAAWADDGPAGVAGSALGAFGDALGLPAALPRWPTEQDRAAALLRLALAALAAGPGVDPADALPLYLRDRVALTTAERDAARSARAQP